MLKILKYLNQECRYCSVLMNNRIFFEFYNFEIVFEITPVEDFDYEEFQTDLDVKWKLEELLDSIVNFDNIFISKSEYLGNREDIKHGQEPFSISQILFEVVSKLKEKYSDLFLDYSLTTNYGFDGSDVSFCRADENYCLQLDIAEKYYDKIEVYKGIIECLDNIGGFIIPEFYWSFYQKNKTISERKLSILTTSTKVRRLGYFKILSNFLEERNKISKRNINRKFEDFALQYEEALIMYSNSKGLIKQTKTGISAKPYIDFSKDIGFLSDLNNIFLRGKDFKVYQVIRQKIDAHSNPFVLDVFDKMYFLEQILLKDFFFISMLLEVIYINQNYDYLLIKGQFQDYILNRLDKIISESSGLYTTKTNRELREISRRIKKWEKPETYLEHVIMPRLNWLYDLGILEMDTKLNIKLTEQGIQLFRNICFWNDLNANWVFDPQGFLKLFYVHFFDNIYNDKIESSSNKIDTEQINQKISFYLNESFQFFKTLAPNRVTASQAISYTKYLLYLFEGIKVGHKYVENYLDSEKNTNFIYKFQEQYNDGYIQKK